MSKGAKLFYRSVYKGIQIITMYVRCFACNHKVIVINFLYRIQVLIMNIYQLLAEIKSHNPETESYMANKKYIIANTVIEFDTIAM